MPTKASQIRQLIAQAIAEQCPKELFSEIALMGSAARGIAHAESDLDMLAWVEVLPSLEERRQFLQGVGIEALAEEDVARPDGSYWLGGSYQGIDFEMGWQSFEAVENSLRPLLAAQTTEHRQLRLGELFLSAITLRGNGVLEVWKPRLQAYPAALAENLLTETLQAWLNTGEIRKEGLLRLVFALNCQWEVTWKWAQTSALPFKPDDFFARLEESSEWQALLIEILNLLPTTSPLRPASLQKIETLKNLSK